MIHKLSLAAYATLLACLAACTPAEPTRTVDYYKANPDERRAKLKDCASNPGEKRREPNCVNASQAEALGALGTSR